MNGRIAAVFAGRVSGKTFWKRRRPTFIAFDEAGEAAASWDRARTRKLEAAKTAALEWLDRGDVQGALVKFVAETCKPLIDGSDGEAIIDWSRTWWLLQLGKSYLPPIPKALAPFEDLMAESAARENMRRWIVGFR